MSETASDPSLAVTYDRKHARLVQRRRARERAGRGIERKPRGKRGSIGHVPPCRSGRRDRCRKRRRPGPGTTRPRPRPHSDRRSAVATTGASLTGVTVSVNVSDALSEPSLAVTLRFEGAGKFSGGVPTKVRVAASKASQPGSAAPLPQRRRVGQAGAVHVREGARRNLEDPELVFRYRLIVDRLCPPPARH